VKKHFLYVFCVLIVLASSCKGDLPNDSDGKQRAQQELLLDEATAQVGMPAIKNFRERRMLKDILELRDQEGVVTYTYLVSDHQAKLVFFCNSVGYGIPYATQYTSPQKPVMRRGEYGGNFVLPQADPNALFSPDTAEGTWVLCKDPHGDDVKVVYVEPRIVVAPFKLDLPEAKAEKP
jgi:hypothetical protein